MLKPCPFCGSIDLECIEDVRSKPHGGYRSGEGFFVEYEAVHFYQIVCNKCFSKSGMFENKLVVEENWNRRTE